MGTVPVKVVAVTQHHRGHGVSTAAFFLGRALAQQHVPVLLGDLTGRHARISHLAAHFPTKKLVPWMPPSLALRDLPVLLKQARADVAGKAACILIDIDEISLEAHADTIATLGIDYLLLACEDTIEGQKSVERVARRYEDLLTRSRIGVAFARVSTDQIDDLPQQTDDGLPILGYWPADYRLAMTNEEISAGASPAEPHQPYQTAIALLATHLIRLVPLPHIERVTPNGDVSA